MEDAIIGPPLHEARLRQAEDAENFPVALRVLPGRFRVRLRAVYDVVRAIDDLGDEGDPAGREAALRGFAAELDSVWAPTGVPVTPVLARLRPVARSTPLPREPFDDLVQANLADQRTTRYTTWDELLGYCRLSANPIGRLVFAIFEVPPEPIALARSDAVCTALQLLEHWQDVAEDLDRGRIYLPARERAAFGVSEADLAAPHAPPGLRSLMSAVTDRAVALLAEGTPLVGQLSGWARLAVAGYVAGGCAAADALRRTGGDVLGRPTAARRRDVARHAAVLLGRHLADPLVRRPR